MEAGFPTSVQRIDSFVDGIGAGNVLSEMWPLASSLLDGSKVVSLEQIAASIRNLLHRSRIVAEGAGASSLAAALSSKTEAGKRVCIISGGNIDQDTLRKIVNHQLPP